MVTLSKGGQTIEVPVMVQPGHADDAISLLLGYGRAACGRVGQGVGHRVEGLRTTRRVLLRGSGGLEEDRRDAIRSSRRRSTTAWRAGRSCARPASEEYQKEPARYQGDGRVAQGPHDVPLLRLFEGLPVGHVDRPERRASAATRAWWRASRRTTFRWSARTRCGADARCTGSASTATTPARTKRPQVVTQPMACQQCENAPCENGLPGGGDVAQPRRPERHGVQPLRRHALLPQQLPVQGAPLQLPGTGTRTCRKSRKLVFNPDVTVRMRGVMEKCTYCVQRIEEARSRAKADGRRALQRRRDRERVPAGLPGRRDRLRQYQRSRKPRVEAEETGPRLRAARPNLNIRPRTTYLAQAAQSESGAGATAEKENSSSWPTWRSIPAWS